MNCPRCGKGLGPGATFCMHCGQMLAHAAPMPAGSMTPVGMAAPMSAPRTTSKKLGFGVLIAALVVLAAAWGLSNTGAFRLGERGSEATALKAPGSVSPLGGLGLGAQDDPNNALGAQGEGDYGSALSAQGDFQPPVALPSQGERVRMPQDVYDWLCHLQRIEAKKEHILSGQSTRSRRMPDSFPKPGRIPDNFDDPDAPNSITGMAVDSSFLDGIRQRIDALSEDWKQLTREFNSYPPPAECRAMAQDYDQAIREIGAQIQDVASMFDSAMSDPFGAIAKLETMKGFSESTIDDPLDQVDAAVGDICQKYETRKWFKISSHRGSPSMLGGSGLGF